MNKPATCLACPAYTVGRSYVPGVGPSDARIALIGQGPGGDEAATGIPFIGQSGRRLDHWLHKAGLPRHSVWVDNVVRCWLPKDRPPYVTEARHCRASYVDDGLLALPELRVVVAVGVPAMQAYLDPKANADSAGMVYRLTGAPWDRWPYPMWGVAVLHPAGIARGNWAAEPFQMLTLERAAYIARTGEWPMLEATEPPPNAILEPTLDELAEWMAAIGPSGVAVDLEMAGRHIVCVGMYHIDSLCGLVVHFLDEHGQSYWEPHEWEEVRQSLDILFRDPAIPKVFHNGQAADILWLEGGGFTVEGYSFDTLLAQHIAYAEMKKSKGLEVCARLYNGSPAWKFVVGDVEGDWK